MILFHFTPIKAIFILIEIAALINTTTVIYTKKIRFFSKKT
ncbi:hypothetical protein TDE_1830 [Treponema denticola ATCC 35405]|uniref:Uncharacterized protein n=1 Tax=Treponema denticola (strain ATCC 35405 / DSM 14222 / CIP 103919 / JCM 8153 / KCTC 15104) TaxID=243275 RepID=Q73LN2_TREDE|nr:hypothetical protein TDE_1830 [Treponema denticola ATCC 35405]